jgi:hypothetical protein
MITPLKGMLITENSVLRQRILVALLSAILSLLAIITDDVINPDGVLYVDVARVFLDSGFSEALRQYNWPFYSILAAGIHVITPLSLINSFHLLNVVLFVLVTDALFVLTQQRLKHPSLMAIAVLLILCFYTLNEYRDYVIRDAGYWAATLYAITALLKFIERPNTSVLIHWQVALLLALLFRLEAIILLLFGPLYFVCVTPSATYSRLKTLAIAYAWLIISLIILIPMVLIFSEHFMMETKFSELSFYLNFESLLSYITNAINTIDLQLIAPVAQGEHYGEIVLWAGLIAILGFDTLTGLSFSYVVLALVGLRYQSTRLENRSQHLLGYFIALQLAMLFFFLLSRHFLTTRYCLLTAMLIFVWCLPAMTTFIQTQWQLKHKAWLAFIFVLLLYSFVDAYHHTGSKKYIISAAENIALSLPTNEKIYTNNSLLKFYMNEKRTELQIHFTTRLSKLVCYHYLVLDKRKLNEKQMTVLAAPRWQQIATSGNGKKSILVYKNLQPNRLPQHCKTVHK